MNLLKIIIQIEKNKDYLNKIFYYSSIQNYDQK